MAGFTIGLCSLPYVPTWEHPYTACSSRRTGYQPPFRLSGRPSPIRSVRAGWEYHYVPAWSSQFGCATSSLVLGMPVSMKRRHKTKPLPSLPRRVIFRQLQHTGESVYGCVLFSCQRTSSYDIGGPILQRMLCQVFHMGQRRTMFFMIGVLKRCISYLYCSKILTYEQCELFSPLISTLRMSSIPLYSTRSSNSSSIVCAASAWPLADGLA